MEYKKFQLNGKMAPLITSVAAGLVAWWFARSGSTSIYAAGAVLGLLYAAKYVKQTKRENEMTVSDSELREINRNGNDGYRYW